MAKKSKQPLPEGVAPRKRDRNPKVATLEGKKAPIPVSRHEITLGVPDSVKVAMADAIMTFATVEQALDHVIWDMSGVEHEDGRLLTAMALDTSDKADIAKKMAQRYEIDLVPDKPNSPTVWSVLRDLCELRNKMAHGVWWMHTLTVPMVSSYRNKGAPGEVISDGFPIARIEAIARQCDRVKIALDRISEKAQALRKKPAEPLQQEKPNTG